VQRKLALAVGDEAAVLCFGKCGATRMLIGGEKNGIRLQGELVENIINWIRE
jgi:hypothetical protein